MPRITEIFDYNRNRQIFIILILTKITCACLFVSTGITVQ